MRGAVLNFHVPEAVQHRTLLPKAETYEGLSIKWTPDQQRPPNLCSGRVECGLECAPYSTLPIFFTAAIRRALSSVTNFENSGASR
jgi:hypothetical protein